VFVGYASLGVDLTVGRQVPQNVQIIKGKNSISYNKNRTQKRLQKMIVFLKKQSL